MVIYKVFFMKYKEAWFKLSEKEQNELMRKSLENLEKLRAKSILICMSYWSNEEWAGFGVEEFPDIDAVQKHAQFCLDQGWLKYIESKTYLGTRYP